MKTLLRFFSISLFLSFAATSMMAQTPKALIHYWNFDNVTAQTISPATPTIPDMPPDFSAITPVKAKVQYYLLPGTSLTASTRYIDPTTGSDSNARYSVVPTGAAGNNGLRLRNPLDSMELRVYAPTTGFTGIVVTYALQSSSTTSGDSTDVFDYSIDGGTTWKNGMANGMKVNGSNVDTLDTTPAIFQGTSWGITVIDLSADKTVENNPNFVFRFRFKGNASLAKGNNRFDNLTFEGNGATSAPKPSISITSPLTSNLLVAGRTVTILFDTLHGVADYRTIEFSPDGGTTWSQVGNISKVTSYAWTVPNSPTKTGMIRITDGIGTIGLSGKFFIVSVDAKTNKIIHYWDFNSFTHTYTNPNIPPIASDFSAKDNLPGSIAYTLQTGAPSNYAGYVDNVGGDTASANLLFGQPAGNGFRVRNPVDMAELRIKIPTTGFQNIAVKYAIEMSSNVSPLTRNFDYSIDGGTTWKTTGLSMLTESNIDSNRFLPVSLNFGTESSVNNNPNLVLRIKFSGSTTGSSGNDRFDNFTVTGDPLPAAVGQSSSEDWNCSIYPNPANEHITISTPSVGPKTISIMDITGKIVLKTTDERQLIILNTSSLTTGVYTVRIVDLLQNNDSMIKFVKE